VEAQTDRQTDTTGQTDIDLIVFDTDKPIDTNTGMPPVKAVLRKRTRQTDRSHEQRQAQTTKDVLVNAETTNESTVQMQTNREEERKPPDGSGLLRFGIGAVLTVIALLSGWLIYKRVTN
jgi:hypothetical protein